MEQASKRRCYGCMNYIEDVSQPCPVCGWRQDSPSPGGAAAPGTLLRGRYLVGKVFSQNAESCVYVAFDQQEDARVWLREFFPAQLARRSHSDQSLLVNEACQAEYDQWRDDFRDLFSDVLAAGFVRVFVPVLDVFDCGNTTYVVEKYIPMLSLRDHLARSGGSIAAPAAKRLFMPLFTALSHFHAKGFVHGGICPDNLYVDAGQKLWLWGLGTRQLALHASASPNDDYCPPEQRESNEFWNPGTDVYALGAVLYRVLTGTRPEGAASRKNNDNLVSPRQLDEDIPENISDAVMHAMALDRAQRIQTVDEFSAALLESESTDTAVFVPASVPVIEEDEARRPTVRTIFKLTRISPSVGYFLVGAALVFLLLGFSISYLVGNVFSALNMDRTESQLMTESLPVETQPQTESKGPSVPAFVGMFIGTVQETDAYLNLYSFEIKETFDEYYPQNVVCRQEPEAGTELEKGGKVTLYVSSGSAYVVMPELKGCSLDYAISALNERNLKYEVEYQDDITIPTDQVISTDQPAGTKLHRFSSVVTLYVAT